MHNPSQEQFDKTFITASEIANEVGVSRTSVHHARRDGKLPDPIEVGDGLVFIWNRAAVTPYVEAWKLNHNKRG
jgi:predicted DNA-binding transcriptional regulator AlpA